MTTKWQDYLSELTAFVTEHPKIKLGTEVIEIPEEYRKDFYRLFDMVRSSFIEGEFPAFLKRAEPLRDNFQREEIELLKNPAVEEITLSPPLRWFIDDVINGLRRPLYDPLFDLLRGKISIENFIQLGRKNVETLNFKLEGQGYNTWIVLALTNLLRPDKFFTISLEVGTSSMSTVQRATHNEVPVREPEENKKISLLHAYYAIFVVPDFIIHSTAIDKYVAIRIEFSQPTWTATNKSKNREWLELDINEVLVPGLITLNVADSPDDLALIRDAQTIARPELVVVSRETKDWYEKEHEWFEEIKINTEIFRPKLGMYIASRDDVPGEILQKLAYQEAIENLSDQENTSNAKIRILNLGFDINRLKIIMNKLDTQEAGEILA